MTPLPHTLLRFRRLLIVVIQLALVAFAWWAAFQLRFDWHPPDWAWRAFWQSLPWLVAIRALTFLPFRLYEGLWKYTSVYDLQILLTSVAASSGVFVLYLLSPLGPPAYPRSIVVIDALIVTMLLGGIRLTRRLVAEFGGLHHGGRNRVLIYGAGDAGEMVVREMRQRGNLGYHPVGFIDDDREKVGRRIHGVRVLGTRTELADVIDHVDPSEILLALPSGSPEAMREIFQLLEPYKLPVKTLPPLRDIISGRPGVEQIRTLEVKDLLDRAPVGLDGRRLERLLQDRTVVVTGAGGSIGSELCRQIISQRPRRLILFERYENSLHAIRLELEDTVRASRGGRTEIIPVIGDVTDDTVVRATLMEYRPHLVFHAAAHKHVPLMEENPCEAVKNNVRGTRILAAAAEEAGVDRFIMISTDKAANPTSVMGASKYLAERIVQAQAVGSGTSYATVRFGNVLGSNGSVVPRFLDQIRRGGPVTVTHPDVRRFFMLIPEAVQLVLHAAAEADAGATYVLDMGEQIRIADLARNLIRLAGKRPDEDIAIEFTGLRPGEKLAEELIGGGEEIVPASVPSVFVVAKPKAMASAFMERIAELEELARRRDRSATLAALAQLSGLTTPELAAEAQASASTEGQLSSAVLEAALPAPQPDSHACPKCGSHMHRSRARRFDQHVRKRFTSRRLYRCSRCGWRGWFEPVDVAGLHVPVAVPQAPDLRALDATTAVDVDARRSFSPKDLS